MKFILVLSGCCMSRPSDAPAQSVAGRLYDRPPSMPERLSLGKCLLLKRIMLSEEKDRLFRYIYGSMAMKKKLCMIFADSGLVVRC